MRNGTWAITLAIAAIFNGTTAGQERPPRLGIVPNYEDTGIGVSVAEVVANSPAAKAGMKVGDRITELAGKSIKDIADFITVIKGLKKGDDVEVRFTRDGKEMKASAKLE